MECLILCCIWGAACIVGFKPRHEKVANILLYTSLALSVLVWLMGTWERILPAGNL
ncbi:Uncharacterised protein [Escherichia coli]|nr:Uncharacterised protein [Escherichia coli]CAD6110392.1 Uncharacterised protein [Escherichia coli]CAD6180739.1 Uncharacterised protein [Escherichia coli]